MGHIYCTWQSTVELVLFYSWLYLTHLLLRSSGQPLYSTRSSSVHAVKNTDWIHLFINFIDLLYSSNKQKEGRFITQL